MLSRVIHFFKRVKNYLFVAGKRNQMDKKRLEKEIDILGKELWHLQNYVNGFKTITGQINSNQEIYVCYNTFLFYVHQSFYREIILSISRLTDSHRDSISILKILQRHVLIGDDLSDYEKEAISKLKGNDFFAKKRLFVISCCLI